MFGKHCIKTVSNTQDTIALSSGEAEYYGLVRVAGHCIGISNMLVDLGFDCRIALLTDASAAKGIASLRGAGNVRHIEVNQLWLQEKVISGDLSIHKIASCDNLADILTKHVDRNTIETLCPRMNCIIRLDRHSIAPEVISQ